MIGVISVPRNQTPSVRKEMDLFYNNTGIDYRNAELLGMGDSPVPERNLYYFSVEIDTSDPAKRWMYSRMQPAMDFDETKIH